MDAKVYRNGTECKVGDDVGYDCTPSLMTYRGRIIGFESANISVVCWYRGNPELPTVNRCREYIPNLRKFEVSC